MKNRIPIVAVLLTVLFAATADAAMKDRLVPITSGKMNIAVDAFIIGTHDRYIATIVRDFDEQAAGEVGETMREMAALHGNKNLVLVEKLVFDKNAKKLSMVDRYMALNSDFQARLSSEPMVDSDMHEATDGTLGAFLWEKVAGPDGLGHKILGQDPAPVTLAKEHKTPADTKRYAVIIKNQVGGIFLDRDSIKKTDDGCSAMVVQSFDYDAEVHFGGLAAQYTYQPYVDAQYAVSTYEYSFEKRAHRLLRFTKFSPEGNVIYSIKDPNRQWITADVDPELPYAMLTVRANLPENVSKLLADDLVSFDAYVRESIAQAKKAREKSQGKETAK